MDTKFVVSYLKGNQKKESIHASYEDALAYAEEKVGENRKYVNIVREDHVILETVIKQF